MAEIVVTRLTPVFAAQIDGADITRALDERTWPRFARPSRSTRCWSFAARRSMTKSDRLQPPIRKPRGHPQHESGRWNAVRAPVESRHQHGPADPAGRSTDGLPAREHALAQRQLVQDGAGALLAALGADHPAGGRRHRVRRHARQPTRRCRRRRSGGSRPSWWFTTSRGRGIRSSPDSSPSASARSILRCAIRSCARTPSTGGERSSWALTPRISRAWRSRRARAVEGASGSRHAAGVRLPSRVARRRPGGLGQPQRVAPRHALRHRALQAIDAAHDDLGRSCRKSLPSRASVVSASPSRSPRSVGLPVARR